MRPLLVLNPNRSRWMTQRVLDALPAQGRPLHGHTLQDGPPVIADAASFAAAAAAVPAAAQQALSPLPADTAVLLACFGDPGLEALRAALPGRAVAGLAEAGMAAAAAGGRRFAVLTCGPAWVPLLTQRAADFGHADALVGVWALPVDGATFATDPVRWLPALQQAAAAAERAGAQALLPGGAVFAGLPLAVASGLPVVDALAAAVQQLQQLSASRQS